MKDDKLAEAAREMVDTALNLADGEPVQDGSGLGCLFTAMALLFAIFMFLTYSNAVLRG